MTQSLSNLSVHLARLRQFFVAFLKPFFILSNQVDVLFSSIIVMFWCLDSYHLSNLFFEALTLKAAYLHFFLFSLNIFWHNHIHLPWQCVTNLQFMCQCLGQSMGHTSHRTECRRRILTTLIPSHARLFPNHPKFPFYLSWLYQKRWNWQFEASQIFLTSFGTYHQHVTFFRKHFQA